MCSHILSAPFCLFNSNLCPAFVFRKQNQTTCSKLKIKKMTGFKEVGIWPQALQLLILTCRVEPFIFTSSQHCLRGACLFIQKTFRQAQSGRSGPHRLWVGRWVMTMTQYRLVRYRHRDREEQRDREDWTCFQSWGLIFNAETLTLRTAFSAA